MNQIYISFCLAFITINKIVATHNGIHAEMYDKCQRALLTSTDILNVSPGLSVLDCVRRCSVVSDCSGVDVCPLEGRHVTCRLLLGEQPEECNNIPAPGSPCQHFQKRHFGEGKLTQQMQTTMVTEVPTTTEIVCQNGGTPNGSRCHCPIQYGGRTCHRLIRDCSEPYYSHGYETEDAALYDIQPQTAPDPFKVQCKFKWGGVMTVFRRGQGSNFDKNWEDYKEGFGDPDSGNFFVGLENLHHLLKQAKFELNIWIENVDWTNGGAFYENVTVGSESESYALSYGSFQDDRVSKADDGFSTSVPMSFSARDNDVNQCYSLRGKAGWYTANCSGFGGVFSDGYFDWPFLGNPFEVSSMSFSFVRTLPVYFDD